MESQNFTPQESLQLISQVIEEAKTRFEENGFIYVFWGFLIAIAAYAQFILLQNEYYSINWYPYLLIPFGMLFSMFYYMRKKKQSNKRSNQISTIISRLWFSVGINSMILGFVFAPMLAENLSPIILILMSVGILVSAVALKSNTLFVSGIFINIAGIVCFKVDWGYQSLVMGTVALVAIAIPGLIMMRNYQKRNAVASV